MASNFPSSLDSYVDPTATSKLNSPSHSQQHINTNDAIEKIEAKVGANSSAVVTSHDYKLSGVGAGDKAASVTGTETLTNKRLTEPKLNEDVAITTTSTQINYLKDATGLTGTGKTVADTSPTLVKPTISGSAQTVTANSDAATVTFNLAASNVHTVTLGGNRTLAISNGTVGQYFAIELTQDATGSRTVTWFTTIRWVGGTTPTLTTTGAKRDSFMFRITGTNTYDGYIVGQNI
jgi:hypothetical protein